MFIAVGSITVKAQIFIFKLFLLLSLLFIFAPLKSIQIEPNVLKKTDKQKKNSHARNAWFSNVSPPLISAALKLLPPQE